MKKYITFHREDFYQMMGRFALPMDNTDCAPIAEAIIAHAERTELDIIPKNWDFLVTLTGWDEQ